MALNSIASAYFTCAAGSVADLSDTTLKAYLYGHSEVINHVFDGKRTHALIRTTVEGTSDQDLSERVRYLANYQAERLQSGLWATSPVASSTTPVTQWHAERFGVDLEPVRSTA